MSQLTFYAPIEKTNDEQRMVFGYASTEAVDSQGEVVKKAALKKAIADYMQFANIREMHQASAVGKTKQADINSKGLYIAAKIIDDNAWRKVKEGVYNGFSIGGKVKTMEDNAITDLVLSEISLVDRPANPEAVFDVWKMADVKKREFSTEERKRLSASGKAMPDGSYPIENVEDLKNAVRSWGRGGAKASVKAHIVRRAKSLKATDELPEDWPGSTKGNDGEEDGKSAKAKMRKGTGDAAAITHKILCLEEILERELLEGDEPTIAALKTAIQALKEAASSELTEPEDEDDGDGDSFMYADNPSDIVKLIDKKILEGKMPTLQELDKMLEEKGIPVTNETRDIIKFEIAGLIVKAVESQMKKTVEVDALKAQANKILNEADVPNAYSVNQKKQFRKIMNLIKSVEENMGNLNQEEAQRDTVDVEMPDEAMEESHMDDDENGNPSVSDELVSLQAVVDFLNERGMQLTQSEISLLRNGVEEGSERTSREQMEAQVEESEEDDAPDEDDVTIESKGVITMNRKISTLKKVYAQREAKIVRKMNMLVAEVNRMKKVVIPLKKGLKVNTFTVEKTQTTTDKETELKKAEMRAHELNRLMYADPGQPVPQNLQDEAHVLSTHIMKLRRELNEQ